MNNDGTGLTRLTADTHIDWDPAWSPDGTQIAFGSYRSGNEDIWVMNADGSNQHDLTNSPARDRHAAWSPLGTKIAFDSNRDASFEIYVMNADGTSPQRLTGNLATDSRPAWSPDGRWIMYQSELEQEGTRYLYLTPPYASAPTRISGGGRWTTSPDWQSLHGPIACPILGTIFDDDITMSGSGVAICALAGNDVIHAGSLDDVVSGGPGNDTIYGQAGDDKLSGGTGNDLTVGGPGADTISCGPGRDTVIADAQDHIAKDCEVIKRS